MRRVFPTTDYHVCPGIVHFRGVRGNGLLLLFLYPIRIVDIWEVSVYYDSETSTDRVTSDETTDTFKGTSGVDVMVVSWDSTG